MQALLAPLKELAEYEEVYKKKRRHRGVVDLLQWFSENTFDVFAKRWVFLQTHRSFE